MADWTYTRPWLYAKQRDAIFCPERYGMIEAGTKTGKTIGSLAWLFEGTLNDPPGAQSYWVAPWFGTTKIAFRRLKQAIPADMYTANESELTITMRWGPIVSFRSAERPDTLYGDDVRRVVLDEASRMREEAFYAIRSTLTATRGPVRAIGNVKGRRNWFFKLAREAEKGARDMHYAKITAWDAVEAGILSRDEIDDAQRVLPDAIFRELYLGEPSDDGGNPFGFEHIAACARLPGLAEGPAIVWGVDLAKAVDWTWMIGLNEDGDICASDRFQKPWSETLAILEATIGQTDAEVDSTGVGDPIVELIQRRLPRVTGVKFTQQSKQQMMEGLAVDIQQHAFGFADGPLRVELDAFEFEATRTGVRYSAPAGAHDDGVVALALARKRYRERKGVQPLRILFNPSASPGDDGRVPETVVERAVRIAGTYWPEDRGAGRR